MPEQSVLLLSGELPANSPLDISVRKRVVQGQALCRLNKAGEATALLNEAERIIPPPDRGLSAEVALARAMCALSANRTAAQRYYAQAADLAHGGDQFIEASGLLGVGYVLLQDERYDEAIDRFKEALALTDSVLVKEKALGNLGFAYSQLGDWKSAASFSRQAESLAAEVNDNGDQEKWLIDLGKAHFALRDFQEAKTHYLQALSLAQRLHDLDNVALCFHNLALVALKLHDPVTAEAYWKDGEALKSERERFHFALDAAEIAAAQNHFVESERLFQDLLPRTGKDMVLRSMVERDLGKVYWQEKKLVAAERMFQAGINTAEEAMSRFTRDEYRMSFLDTIQFYEAYIHFLVKQNRAEEALQTAERGRAQVLALGLGLPKKLDRLLSLSAIKSVLKQRHQRILAYSLTDEESYLWLITPSEFKLFRLPGHAELFSQIDAANREIQEHRTIEDSPNGQRLYQTLIRPAERLIPKGSSVIITSSKVLSLVNFETLIVPGSHPHYWIEDVDIQTAGSLALLTRSRPKPSKRLKEILAMGAPVEASTEFPTLKHAPEEMQRVRNHFRVDEETIISGKEATPAAYRASDPGSYRFIHLDTHGVASDLSPLDSAIILSPGSDNSYKLYAREIKDTPLSADLVTISACYGAGTRWYQGEGIVGLAWAFMRAGAHQVVAALWEVDDASSPQLMDDFYSELSKGKSAAEALRAAKLKMLHSTDFHKRPYYWASLQLYTGS